MLRKLMLFCVGIAVFLAAHATSRGIQFPGSPAPDPITTEEPDTRH